MGAVLPSKKPKEIQYLVCWLSLVGPVTRLRVPSEIASSFPPLPQKDEEDFGDDLEGDIEILKQ